jgi:hypothetical protein
VRIENLRTEERSDGRRVAADIVWETADRPWQTLYFEARYPHAADLHPSPDAFALASLPFAVWWGERRLRLAGSLCTRFADNLQSIMAVYAHWFARCSPLAIEPLGGYAPTLPRAPARTASFLSGGVDGLATLRANRLSYRTDHPESVRDCIVLFGANDFETTAEGPVPERLEAFERLKGRLQALAHAEDFELLPVQTNTRLLSGDYACWTSVGFGAANSAVAHALSRRFTKALLASGGDGVNPPAGASHPLLDPYFSTAAVQIQPDQVPWTRLDKLRLLAGWPAALDLMQPCHYTRIPPAGQINCGRCEKCVRTMLGLICLGKLAEAGAFADDDVTPEMVRAIPISNPVKAGLLEQLVDPLEAAGRADLAGEIRRKLLRQRLRRYVGRLKPPWLRRSKGQ